VELRGLSRAVPNCGTTIAFGYVLGAIRVVAGKVCDGAGDAGNSIQGPRGKTAAFALACASSRSACSFNCAIAAHRIAGNFPRCRSARFRQACFLESHERRRQRREIARGALAAVITDHVVEGTRGDVDLQVDSGRAAVRIAC